MGVAKATICMKGLEMPKNLYQEVQVDKFIESVPHRCTEVLKNNGLSITDLLCF